MKIDFVSAYILAGGKSERMGENKAFLFFREKPFIDEIYNGLSRIFKNVTIVTKPEYKALYKRKKLVFDIMSLQTPLVGILTALKHSINDFVFIKSCDNPIFSADLIKAMTEQINGYDVVMPKLSDGFHPLFAIYSKNCLTPIENQLKNGNRRTIDFFRHVNICLMDEEKVKKYDPDLVSFININTKKDYELFKGNYL